MKFSIGFNSIYDNVTWKLEVCHTDLLTKVYYPVEHQQWLLSLLNLVQQNLEISTKYHWSGYFTHPSENVPKKLLFKYRSLMDHVDETQSICGLYLKTQTFWFEFRYFSILCFCIVEYSGIYLAWLWAMHNKWQIRQHSEHKILPKASRL